MRKISEFLKAAMTCVVLTVIAAILGPVLLVGSLIDLPIDYIRFKRSRYQKDFPRKYSSWCGPHIDNALYTIVKERELPIRYFRQNHLNYEKSGWFLYNDILLDFGHSMFEDETRNVLCKYFTKDEEDLPETEEDTDDEDLLSVAAQKRDAMDAFHRHEPDQPCTRVVFFINQSSAEDMYDDAGMEELRTSDDFVLYTKKTLADQLEKFIREN